MLFFSLGIFFWKACSPLGPLSDMRFLRVKSSMVPPRGARKGTPKTWKSEPRKHEFLCEFIHFFSFFMFFSVPKTSKKLINPMLLACFGSSKKGPKKRLKKGPPKGTPKVTKMKPKIEPKCCKKGSNLVSFCCWLSSSLFFSFSFSVFLSLSLLSLSSFFSLSAAAAAASVFLVLSLSFSFSFFSIALSCLALGKVSFLKCASRSC